MNLWQWLWRLETVLVALMVAGCSTAAPTVRVESGARGELLLFIPRTATVEPVEVPPAEVTQALQRMARQVRLSGSPRETVDQLLQLDALYGDYLFLQRERKFVPLQGGTPLEGALTPQEQQWATWYTDWCRSEHRFNGDCLGGALVAGKYMDLRGRYMWAMAMSKSPVLEEFEKALGHMVSMRAVLQAAMCTVITLLVLLAMPEPASEHLC